MRTTKPKYKMHIYQDQVLKTWSMTDGDITFTCFESKEDAEKYAKLKNITIIKE